MILISIILILAVALRDSIKGNKHDLRANLRLLAEFLIIQGIGMALGYYYAFISHALLRFCLFDYSYILFENVLEGQHLSWHYQGDGKNDAKMAKIMRRIDSHLIFGLRVMILYGYLNHFVNIEYIYKIILS